MSLREQWIRPLDALPLDYQHVIAITSSGQEEEMYLVDDKWHIVDGVRIPIECVVFWHEKREQPTVEMAEDCVKREDAKKFLYERLDRLNDDELYDIFSKIIDDMYNELPSVQPTVDTSVDVIVNAWMPTKCPICSHTLSKHHGDGYYTIPYKFKRCPECGRLLNWGCKDEE